MHRLLLACVALTACSTPSDPGVDAAGADARIVPVDAAVPAVDTGVVGANVDEVFAAEYVTSFLRDGEVYSVGGTLARRGSGAHPPDALYPPQRVLFPEGTHIVTGAGGLHFTIAADDLGHVYEWGDIDSNPDLVTHHSPVQLTDASGTPFVLPSGVRQMAASITTSIALAGDGSVWIWDDCSGGRAGDGTGGPASVTHPTRVPFPAGVSIERVAIGDVVLALDTSGTVWAWGTSGVMENLGTNNPDDRSPHAITQTSTGDPMPPIVAIATGQSYSYALTASGDLFTWGLYAEIAGLCAGSGWCPRPRPVLANDILTDATAGGAHAISIDASTGGSYAIFSDGTLWAWGTNGQGLVGNGDGPDWATTTPPYTWDWSKDSMMVTRAVHIAPGVSNFTRIFTGSADVFYVYALTSDGRLFSWGRNKTGDLGSGVVPLNSSQAAMYPNSWDVRVPTEVHPMEATPIPVSSPVCESAPSSPSCWCGSGPSDPQHC